MGGFPRTKRGDRLFIVAVERMTRWIEAKPLRNKKAATVAHFIMHRKYVVVPVISPGVPPAAIHV
jgi:hypothetical protein